jgi:hypothetical protein
VIGGLAFLFSTGQAWRSASAGWWTPKTSGQNRGYTGSFSRQRDSDQNNSKPHL